MSSLNKTVVVMLDDLHSAMADELAKEHPIWLRASATNRQAAERLWLNKALPTDHVTLFNAAASDSTERIFLGVLETVDEHHPDWTRLRVLGSAATPAIETALARFGKGTLKRHTVGFDFDRPHASESD